MTWLRRAWQRLRRDRSRQPSHSRGPDHPPKDRRYATRDEGLWVRSHGEQRIANWLSRRGVAFQYEPPIEGMRPDFLISGTNIVVEYWGGAAYQGYEKRMVRKLRKYARAGIDVVSLFPAHLHELEDVLEAELRHRGVPLGGGAPEEAPRTETKPSTDRQGDPG